jgi:glycopeptide antibiotics resistance protein
LEDSFAAKPTRLITLRRILLPAVFILFIGSMAALLNSRYGYSFGLQFIQQLAEYEAFHVVAHLIIFSLLIIMIARAVPDPYFRWVAWGFVIGGTLLIEIIQLSSANGPVTGWLIAGSIYDLLVNISGAAIGMIILRFTHK